MGYFRRVKIGKYRRDEILKKIEAAEIRIKSICDEVDTYEALDLGDFKAALEEWAVWREALARHDNENQSVLDG